MLQDCVTIVRKLTPVTSGSPILRVWCRNLGALLILLGSNLANGATATTLDWQATEEITAAAERYLQDMMGPSGGSTSVQAGNLDARHRLAQCGEPLQPFLRRGSEIKARTIVGVRCTGPKPWKVYLPVDVIVTQTVLVAKRTLPRGHRLSADDVHAQQRDVSRLLSGYISELAHLSGQRLKTQLLAGKILTPAMLQAEVAIRRGQSVTLIIGSGQMSIRTSGTALMDGAVNQRIQVENSHSGRVVEGIVRSRENVEVLLQDEQRFSYATPKVSPNLADTRTSNNDR